MGDWSALPYDAKRLADHLTIDEKIPIGPAATGFTAVGSRSAHQLVGSNIFDTLTAPFAIIRDSRVALNIVQFAAWAHSLDLQLAPHVKTTMSPQLFARQLWGGAWALTAAHIGQVAVFRQYGVRRIVLANQLVDPSAIDYLAREMRADPLFEPIVWVDSAAGVTVLSDRLAAAGLNRKLLVAIELGVPGGRTGVRSVADGVVLAKAVAASSELELVGVAGFEGSAGSDGSAESLTAVREFCVRLRELALAVAAEYPSRRPFIVSAGGSSYFDIVAQELAPTVLTAHDEKTSYVTVLRSGSYITHDEGHIDELSPYHRRVGPSFVPALEIWAYVLSVPEPGLAIVGAGKRDLAYDIDLPVVARWRTCAGELRRADGFVITELNDQHAFMTFPDDMPVAVGDLMHLGISHPCTAFDKWRVLALGDDDDRITGVCYTFF